MKSKVYKSLSAACVLTFGITVSAQNPQPNPQPQQPPQPRPSDSMRPSMPTAAAHDASATVTLTGCVARDTGTNSSMNAGAQTARGSQVPAGSQAATMFKLTNVEMANRAGSAGASSAQSGVGRSSSSQAPGSPHQGAGTAGASAHVSEYRLVAGANVDLSAHLNHRVSVTGTRTGVPSGSPDAPTGMSSGSAQAPGAGSSSNSGSGSSSAPTSSQRPASDPRSAPVAGQEHGATHNTMNIPTLMVTNVTMIASTCQ